MTFAQLTRFFSRAIAPLRRRVQLMVGRALLTVIDDSTTVQSVDVELLSDELAQGVERFQNYGFTAVPYANCEGVIVFVGGSRAHGIVIATDDRAKRPTGLLEGDSALYNGNGVRVLCDNANDEVLLGNSPTVYAALSDLVDARFSSLQLKYDSHFHVTTATVGPSGVPGLIGPPNPIVGALATVAATEVKIK